MRACRFYAPACRARTAASPAAENFCKAPAGQWAGYFGADVKFGLMGSIHTKDGCDAAGGMFFPHVLGWMVHVYPYETSPEKIWSIDDEAQGHDNMDHAAMPGMKMN